jgi:hypothetical protein
VGKGFFDCPHCGTSRLYERKKATRYLTLYFIPVLPMGEAGEFIECQTCHHTFEASALDIKASERKLTLVEMLNSVQTILEDGKPVEYLLRDLTAAGLDRDVALKTIEAQIGSSRKVCRHCGLTYAPSVETCAECGQPLEMKS